MLHASCIAIDGRAVLIEGPSGSGKSDLALRLIDRGAVLVSDDYTQLSNDGYHVVATPPARLSGQIEVRGIGIVAKPHLDSARVALLVTLGGPVPRLPEAAWRCLAGAEVPQIALDAQQASAAIKVELALDALGDRA
jgi:hypothetical protein